MAELFNEFTNRRGLIVYGGEASADYGMVVSEAPTFEKPTRKGTAYQVPGRSGDIIFQQDAWNDVTRSYRVWLAENGDENLAEQVDAVTGWLFSKTGYTRLEDSFEPEVFRLAYYNGGQEITNELTQYGEATLSFICRPERFYKSGEQAISVSNGDKINNPTRFTSKPIIHLEGTGTVTIAIGGATMSATLTDYLNIDTETMNAYRLPAENKNDKISGTFPTIAPGVNTIGLTGSVTLCTIVPRYFTI